MSSKIQINQQQQEKESEEELNNQQISEIQDKNNTKQQQQEGEIEEQQREEEEEDSKIDNTDNSDSEEDICYKIFKKNNTSQITRQQLISQVPSIIGNTLYKQLVTLKSPSSIKNKSWLMIFEDNETNNKFQTHIDEINQEHNINIQSYYPFIGRCLVIELQNPLSSLRFKFLNRYNIIIYRFTQKAGNYHTIIQQLAIASDISNARVMRQESQVVQQESIIQEKQQYWKKKIENCEQISKLKQELINNKIKLSYMQIDTFNMKKDSKKLKEQLVVLQLEEQKKPSEEEEEDIVVVQSQLTNN